ncbi:hypothetical protein ACEPAH_3975 [Sanghuangporus vaninii]
MRLRTYLAQDIRYLPVHDVLLTDAMTQFMATLIGHLQISTAREHGVHPVCIDTELALCDGAGEVDGFGRPVLQSIGPAVVGPCPSVAMRPAIQRGFKPLHNSVHDNCDVARYHQWY